MVEPTLWAGRTLREWLPVAVADVVRAAAPQRIVVFGSVAEATRGLTATSTCSLCWIGSSRGIGHAWWQRSVEPSARAPIDIFVTDLAEYERRKDVIGSMAYWPEREGEIVYERAA